MSGITTATLWGREKVPRQQPEMLLQTAVAQYLAWALPPDAVAHHSPGEGKRSRRAQGELKRSGFTSGWPDLEIVWDGKVVFVELKAGRGALSAAQRATHRKLHYCGAPVCVCRSPEDVEFVLRAHGLPLRATVSGWRGERLA